MTGRLITQVTNIPLPKVRSLDPAELVARRAAVAAFQQRRAAQMAAAQAATSSRAKPAVTVVCHRGPPLHAVFAAGPAQLTVIVSALRAAFQQDRLSTCQ